MVKLTFEFDPTDYPAYADMNDPECRSNLRDLFYGMVLDRIEARAGINQHFREAVNQDIELAREIIRSMKIEVIDAIN